MHLQRFNLTYIALAALAALAALFGFTFALADSNSESYSSWRDSSYAHNGHTGESKSNWTGGSGSYGYSSSSIVYEANLTGSEEVPSVAAGTSGSSKITLHSEGNTLAVTLTVLNGNDITAAHLHCAPRGVNGPVVAHLFSDSAGRDVNGTLTSLSVGNGNIVDSDCTSKIGYDIANISDLTRAIKSGHIYVNVHSKQHPDGVARGQLTMYQDHNNWNDDEKWKDGAEKYWWNNTWWYKKHDGTWYDSNDSTWDGNTDFQHDYSEKHDEHEDWHGDTKENGRHEDDTDESTWSHDESDESWHDHEAK